VNLVCRDFVELITDYLEGVLPPDEHAAVEHHLTRCEGCTTYLEQMRASIALTGRPPDEPLPSELEAALVAAFRDLG
jgi:anti-sigma factor RsiW